MKLSWWTKFFNWYGFISGQILHNAPWKTKQKSHSTWLSFVNLYVIIFTIFRYWFFISLGKAAAQWRSSPNATINQPTLRSQVTNMSVNVGYVILILGQLYIWLRSRRMIQFSQNLESYSLFVNRFGSAFSGWWLNIGMWCILILSIIFGTLGMVRSIYEGSLRRMPWINVLSFWPLAIIAIVFQFSTVFTMFGITGLVVTRTIQMVNMLDSVCDHFERVYMLSNDVLANDERITAYINVDFHKNAGSSGMSSRDLLRSLQEIKAIFKEYDVIYGPIFIFIIMVSFATTISLGNLFLDNEVSPLRAVLNLLGCIVHSGTVSLIIELGHTAHCRVSLGKSHILIVCL